MAGLNHRAIVKSGGYGVRNRMDNLSQEKASSLLSRQVTEARYFFLTLAPNRRTPLTLVMGGRERCNPDYVIERRHFPYYGFEYVSAGRGSVKLGAEDYPLVPGTVFAYSPHTPCEIHTDEREPMEKYFLCFAGTAVTARLRRSRLRLGKALLLPVHAEIGSVLEDLLREGQSSSRLAHDMCATLFEFLFLKIEEAATMAPHANNLARQSFLRCKAFIDAHADRLGTLSDIAAAVGIEKSSICRWFRRYEGTSPHQYLLRRKMNIAARYLIKGDSLVKDIAQRVGFENPFHFSRCFKAVHGLAPSALLYSHRSPRVPKTPGG